MATYVSRPAWELRARSVMSARLVVPLGLGLLVALSLMLRNDELNVGYWVDEGLSVGIADRPLTDIPGILHQDGSPPLYYCLLNLWMALTDSGEKATHTLSVVFALAAVPLAFWGAGLVFDRRAAWFAAVLTALNPYLSQYAQETRMYTLVVLLSLLATSLYLRAYTVDERPARRWPVLFGLALAAALYTHNWALFLGVAMFIAWVGILCLAPRPERRWRLRDGALGFGLAALLYLPWVPTLLFQAAHTGAPWSRRPNYEQLTMEATHRLLGHTAWLVLVVAAGGGVVALLRAGRGRQLTAQGRAVAAVGIVAVGTMLLAYGASQLSPAWAMRYLAVAVPPFLLLVAAGLAASRGLGILGLVIVSILWGYDVWPTTKSNVRDVATADRPEPEPRRRGRVDPARAGARAAPLPAAGAALRDAHRLREGRRRHRLARRRRAPRGELRAARPRADPRRPPARPPARADHADHLRHGALAGAVDQARAPALGGVQPVSDQRHALSPDRDLPAVSAPARAQPRRGDGVGQDDRLTVAAGSGAAGAGTPPP